MVHIWKVIKVKSFIPLMTWMMVQDSNGSTYYYVLALESWLLKICYSDVFIIQESVIRIPTVVSSGPVVFIGCLTAFYVVLVPMQLVPSKPLHFAYVIISFCTWQNSSTF